MSNLADVIQQLTKERDQAQTRVEHLDQALEALTGGSGAGGVNGKRRPAERSGRPKTLSTAARKRISAAQRARWAKWKAARRGK